MPTKRRTATTSTSAVHAQFAWLGRRDIDVRAVQVDVVEQHPAIRARPGDLLVHPVDAANHRRLPAAGGADDRGHVSGLEGQVEVLDRVIRTVIGVQALELDMPRRMHLVDAA